MDRFRSFRPGGIQGEERSMIYIVEVPHRMPAKCWVAADRAEVTRIVNELAARSGESFDSFEQAVEWIGHDLHDCAVFENGSEAVAALESHPIFSGHQGARAEGALRDKLIYFGDLPEPGDDEEGE